MKQAFLLFLLISSVKLSVAQDTLYLSNGRKVSASVIDANPENIRYHLTEEPDYMIRKIGSRKVYMIKYRTGREEIIRARQDKYGEPYFSRGKNDFYVLSAGIGQSHGFGGIMFEHRWGQTQGWGYHAGIGVAPFGTTEHKATVNFSAGVKFYFYRGFNIDLQFGTVPATKQITAWDDSLKRFNTHDTVRIAYGPSLLVGWDWFFNRYFGLTFSIGCSVNTTRPTYDAFMVAVDFGVIGRLPEKKKPRIPK
jgi:hypothetical protein